MIGGGQKLLPAVSRMKDYEYLLESPYETIVLLNTHIAQLGPVVKLGKKHGKRLLIHLDLIDGLKADEPGTEFVAQEFRPDGVITTRRNVIVTARRKGLTTIQRLFLLDQMALENSYTQIEKANPDYVEVLPGVIPDLIAEVRERTGRPVIAGGLIRTEQHVRQAIEAGASAVTTSRKELWKAFAGGL